MGLFQKFKTGLAKTFAAISGKARGLFGGRAIDAASIESLEEALYTADFGSETTAEILSEIKTAFKKERELRGQAAAEIGAAVLTRALAGSEGKFPGDKPPPPPGVIVLTGVNGSGKTTTAAKLAWRIRQSGQKVTLAACDTFRAAAVEQLKTWAARLDLDIVASRTGADAAAVAFDALAAARARGSDWLIVDTAGRLHTKDNLMAELAKIRRVLQKQIPDAPHHSWLVADGSLGSNTIEQARVFHKSFGLTGLVVTKLDGTSRGGALVGAWRELKLPVYFIGLGEQPDDLQPFDAPAYARAVFGLD
ncbi:MAG: signal recognition particle-docking protein FtsY [Opitutaceae bacterium]|jgi:fused signal recognition particle receptor|nr:signal recognition particle-docking protein FtsY [Opitutaceae bacterium]